MDIALKFSDPREAAQALVKDGLSLGNHNGDTAGIHRIHVGYRGYIGFIESIVESIGDMVVSCGLFFDVGLNGYYDNIVIMVTWQK